MPEYLSIFVTIGNSDNKLTQQEWSDFCGGVDECVRAFAQEMFGEFYAVPNAPWQNACWSFSVDASVTLAMQTNLRALASDFEQDSILWTVGELTFLKPEHV